MRSGKRRRDYAEFHLGEFEDRKFYHPKEKGNAVYFSCVFIGSIFGQ